MRQMYLKNIRVLWRKYYPMLHGFVSYSGREEHVIAGPAQLSQLGQENLDRVVVFNQRLGGPLAYQGGDLTLLAGLYSVPGEDAARALLDTLGNIAALPGVGLGDALKISGVVKGGVESILKLNDTRLELGVQDTFSQTNSLRAGYYIAMDAAGDQVDFDRLWLLDTGLKEGTAPAVSRDYTAFDYMIVEVERLPSRDNWPALDGFKAMQDKFDTVMSDGTQTADQKRERLKTLWPEFQTLVSRSTELITADKKQIADSVAAHLKALLEAGNTPFETRAWGGSAKRAVRPERFDLLDVANVDEGGVALKSPPF